MMQQQPQLEYFLLCKLTRNMCLDSIILKRIVFLRLNHLIVMTSCIYLHIWWYKTKQTILIVKSTLYFVGKW